jgi:hypothetical protein
MTGSGDRPSLRSRAVGWAIASTSVTVVVASMLASGVRVRRDILGASWQVLDLDHLGADPVGSIWNLHIQPPLHNALIGVVLRWSPFPDMGTLFVLYVAALLVAAVALTELLVGWRVPPVAAGLVSGIALANPSLLSTIGIASYEVPLAAMAIVALLVLQRHLHQPGWATLLGLSGVLTAMALTRSLFHPSYVVALVALAGVATRCTWRQVLAASAIPVVLVGGWMLKNQVLFGTPTLSSWFGFNLQRGVVAPLEREAVERAVDDRAVSTLALAYPWGTLDRYEEWLDGCEPRRDHPVLTAETRADLGGFEIANFNHQCYLPLYAQSEADARTLVRREPGRYLATRVVVLQSSFAMANVGIDDTAFGSPEFQPPDPTWMDAAADVVLVPVTITITMDDWNLPLLPGGAIDLKISLLLLVLAAGVGARGVLAGVRVARSGWIRRGERLPPDEVQWVAAASMAILVIVVGDLLEFGENGRFRSMLDPLLVALPAAGAWRLVATRRHRADVDADEGTGVDAVSDDSSEAARA